MQPVNSVATKCGASKLPNRIFGICPIGEDRRIPLWRRCIHRNLARELDFAVRYGGEEFVVVMPEPSTLGLWGFRRSAEMTKF